MRITIVEVRGLKDRRDLGFVAIVLVVVIREVHLCDLGWREGDAGAYDADVARGLAHAQTAGLDGIRLRSMVSALRLGRPCTVLSPELCVELLLRYDWRGLAGRGELSIQARRRVWRRNEGKVATAPTREEI